MLFTAPQRTGGRRRPQCPPGRSSLAPQRKKNAHKAQEQQKDAPTRNGPPEPCPAPPRSPARLSSGAAFRRPQPAAVPLQLPLQPDECKGEGRALGQAVIINKSLHAAGRQRQYLYGLAVRPAAKDRPDALE